MNFFNNLVGKNKKKVEIKTIKREVVFKGKILNLRVDEILLPSGKRTKREIVEYRGAVTLIPVFENGKILFVKQYRYVVGDELLELPAGKLEAGEEFEETARRELVEETGYYPKRLRKIASFYVAPGYSTEYMHLYLAQDLEKREGTPDFDEIISPVIIEEGKVKRMLKDGDIKDAKTILGLLYYFSMK